MMGDLGSTNPAIGRYSPTSNQTLPPYISNISLRGELRWKVFDGRCSILIDRIDIYLMKRSKFLIYADEAIKSHKAM